MTQVRTTPAPVRIAYELRGDGPLVVFLHGIGGNRANWETQLVSFGDRFCAVAWDARGYGDSDDPPGDFEFGDFTDDLGRVLDHLGSERAHLVGLSMGGMIALEFCARRPNRVATLVLADTLPGFAAVLSEEARSEFLAKRLEPLEAGKTPRDIAGPLVETLVSPNASAEVRGRVRRSLEAIRAEPYKTIIRAGLDTDFRGSLARISVPTLVVVGDADRVTPPELSALLADGIPGAERAVIPNAGHLTNIECPEAFDAVVGRFLDAHAPRASTCRSGND